MQSDMVVCIGLSEVNAVKFIRGRVHMGNNILTDRKGIRLL